MCLDRSLEWASRSSSVTPRSIIAAKADSRKLPHTEPTPRDGAWLEGRAVLPRRFEGASTRAGSIQDATLPDLIEPVKRAYGAVHTV